MIEFTDNNNKLRRITEFTMEEWNGEEWVTIEDYTPDDEEDRPVDVDDVRVPCGIPGA